MLGCTTAGLDPQTNDPRGQIVQFPTNYDAALQQNQTALSERQGPPDVALYNIGLILAHPSNPKKDRVQAIQAFRILATGHSHSILAEPAKIWIQVLEQQQKVVEERQKLAAEKRGLDRERERLLQERQKAHYEDQKSQQLDLQIEMQRRRLLTK